MFFCAIFVVITLAWGAFAFGAVYEWAYVPLLWAVRGAGRDRAADGQG